MRHGNTGGKHLGGSGRPRSVERPRRRSGDRDRGVRGDDRREAGKRTPCLCSSGPAEAGSVGVNRRVPRRGRVRIRVLLRATRARVQIWVESFGWQKSDGRFLLPRRYALERSRTRRASSQKEAGTGGKAFAVEPRRKGSCVRRLAGIIPYASRSTRRALLRSTAPGYERTVMKTTRSSCKPLGTTWMRIPLQLYFLPSLKIRSISDRSTILSRLVKVRAAMAMPPPPCP